MVYYLNSISTIRIFYFILFYFIKMSFEKWSHLPSEMQFEILKETDLETLCAIRETNRESRDLVRYNYDNIIKSFHKNLVIEKKFSYL